MPTKWAYPVLTIASAYVITFDVIYMFPYAMPFSIDVMNWNCVRILPPAHRPALKVTRPEFGRSSPSS